MKRRNKMMIVLSIAALFVFSSSCTILQKRATETNTEVIFEKDRKLADLALELLNPESDRYNPEKARNVLEYNLTHGGLKTINVPTATLLALLREERQALEKSRGLEQQLQVLKEIDLGHAERSMEKEKL